MIKPLERKGTWRTYSLILRLRTRSVSALPVLLITLTVLLISPPSLFFADEQFSLSLDLDSSEGDQAVSYLDVLPNRTVPIQIFATDIGTASDLSLRFEFDPTQVAYEAFKRSNIVSGTYALTDKDFLNIGIILSPNSPSSGHIGTIHFRTTEAFSGTGIRLVRAKLVRDGQTEAVSMDLSIALRLAKPPSSDFDRSGRIDVPDFLLFVDMFGSHRGQDRYESKYDLDVDGEIGISDFLLFIDSFGKVVNRAPVFTSRSPVRLFVDENIPAGEPINGPISATDAEGYVLTYRLSGQDADSFAIDAGTGQIQTREGITYDYEYRTIYSVIVEVNDGQGGTARLLVIIKVNDLKEPPSSPPSNFLVIPSNESLHIHFFQVPDERGRPPVRGYHAEIRKGEDGEWGTRRTIYGRKNTSVYYHKIDAPRYQSRFLENDQLYQVRVRTWNRDGASEWSAPVSGTPEAPRRITFSDANLQAVIAKILGKTSDAPITEGDMARLTRLNAPNKAIRDLTGLEYATNLTWLNLHGNAISDIAPLVANTGLDKDDWVLLNNNPLSATSRNTHIPALSARGVNVRFSDNLVLPTPSPAFSPYPVRDYTITLPITDNFSGNRTTALNPTTASVPGTATHVHYDAGTITVPSGTSALNFSNSPGETKKSFAATFTKTAAINVTNATAVHATTYGNTGDVALVNKGTITISQRGIGLRPISRGSGNAYSANYGTVTINNSTDRTIRSVMAQIGKRAAPHDDTHVAQAINLSGGSIVNTGSQGRQDGLFVETGGHLARSINYGTVNVAGKDSRAVTAQTLWGAAQTHNTGSITTTGTVGSDGIHSETCAAYSDDEGCHDIQAEIQIRRNTHAAGPAYARNYNTGNIQTSGRFSQAIMVAVKKAGRAYGINEGTVSTTGDRSSGIFAYGHFVQGFRSTAFQTLLQNHPTADYMFSRFSPDPIGEIRLTYAANTGRITTRGEDASGLRAHHGLGGKIEVANSGRINTSGTRSHGIYAQAFGRDITLPPPDNRNRVYPAGDIVIDNYGDIVVSGNRAVGILAESKNLLNPGRSAGSGDIEIVVDGTIIASGDNGIGISAETDTGDITIVVTGFIRANAVGIRVNTSGKVLINLIGTVDAPTLWETFGDNKPSQITVNQ